jgi:methylglyoxal synthase
LVQRSRNELLKHELHVTDTAESLVESVSGIPVIRYKSGLLDGDQQLGAKLTEQTINIFIDPLEAQPQISFLLLPIWIINRHGLFQTLNII